MNPHRKVLLLGFLLSCAVNSLAVTWRTQSAGYWQNADTWMGNAVPPYSSADTFMISHPVIFGESIVLSAGAYIQIGADGGLCGHKNITVQAGAGMLKYGLLELDTMFIPGGHVLCKLPKEVVITRYAIITNSGSMVVDSCGLAVGPWFTCRLPEYAFAMPVAVPAFPQKIMCSIYPNPNSGSFVLKGRLPSGNARLRLSDATGRAVVFGITDGLAADTHIIDTALSDGIYYWQLTNEGQSLGAGTMVVNRR